MMGECKRQASDEEEREGSASDEGEQEAGEWWGRARHRRMMGKSKRQARARGRRVVG